MNHTFKLISFVLFLISLSVLTACTLSTNLAGVAVLPTAVVQSQLPTLAPPVTATPTTAVLITPTTQPGNTAVPVTATTQPMLNVCTDAATFIADVTVPDGSQFAPYAGFMKTWRIKNNGSCTWDGRYKLVHAGGHTLGVSATAFALPATVAPGQTIDLSVSMFAPAVPGTYQSDWKLQNPEAVPFGIGANHNASFWVKIVVPTPQPVKSSSVSGFAWQDKDHDNSVDGNEMLANVTITLATGAECRTVSGSTKTDNNGRFTFTNLAAGAYCLLGVNGSTTVSQANVVLAENQQLANINVTWPPVWPQPVIISGLIYQDTNQNGVYNTGEPVVANREVWLVPGTACHVSANAVAVVFSGTDGRYTFAGAFNGSYCVGLKGNGGLDDVVGVAVAGGQTLNNIHLRTPLVTGAITGWLWEDVCFTMRSHYAHDTAQGTDNAIQRGNCVSDGNGGQRADGMIQPGEGYIAGATILLQAGACATGNPAILATAVTDANGRYTFTNLASGTYCIFMNTASGSNASLLLPGNWTFPAAGIWYHQVTITPGQHLSPVNFGWDYELK